MKNKKNNKPVQPAPIIQVSITIYSDNSCRVNGFPNDHDLASEIMRKGIHTMNRYFIRLAKEGKLNEFNRVPQSNILVPDKRIITPGRN